MKNSHRTVSILLFYLYKTNTYTDTHTHTYLLICIFLDSIWKDLYQTIKSGYP